MNDFMKSFWAAFLAIIATGVMLTVFTFVMFAGMIASMSAAVPQVEAGSIVRIDLSKPIADAPMANPLDGLDPITMKITRTQTLLSVLNTIEKAATDDRIEGIYLDMNTYGGMGMATLEEIRNALLKFKESDKFIISYADYYSQGSYYLATVADKVYMNPEGGLYWVGLSSTSMFYKGLLEKLDLKPEVIRHGEFKAAVEPFILEKMSPENRLQTTMMVTSVWENMVSNIAKARNLEAETLKQYATELSLMEAPEKTKELKMIDDLLYEDEVEKMLAQMAGDDEDEEPTFISLAEYAASPSKSGKLSKNKIAVVYAEGSIVDGKGGKGEIGGASLSKRLAKALDDEKVKAVVLRVNSPGGSALASEVIWRQMEQIKKEKPVIVSMGNYAASGGYYIAAPADAILASPSTLTGSIGVFGLLMNGEDTFKNKLGVTFDVVKTNPSADMSISVLGISPRGITEVERAHIQKGVERVYTTFVGHVAAGRNMSFEAVDAIGGGRVWSGANALENGLIDGFGGLKDAIALAADRAGVADDFRVSTAEEAASNPFAMMLEMMGETKISTQNMPEEVAELVEAYQYLERILSYKGVQAIMPYQIEIQ